MNKKALTEADIRSKFITPALVGPNGGKWNLMTQIREEAFFTRGRVTVRGRTVTRGKAKKADYILSYKPNLPLAVVEAKDNNHSDGAGMQQALSTGVDAQTCHLIVLDRHVASMTEFKQIIGRGTRINEDYGKLFFTIMDFRRATTLFTDPDFDGEPVQIYEPKEGETVVPPEDTGDGSEDGAVHETSPPYGELGKNLGFDGDKPAKYYVNSVPVRVAIERVQYLDANGRLITESLRDYSSRTVRQAYASLHVFLNVWHDAEKKQSLLDELGTQGVFFEELAALVGWDYDAFDLICHVAFDRPPRTRQERAAQVKKRDVFARYGIKARAVLDALLAKYADGGLRSVESLDILKVEPLTTFGTPVEIVTLFGGKPAYLAAIRELETALYQEAA